MKVTFANKQALTEMIELKPFVICNLYSALECLVGGCLLHYKGPYNWGKSLHSLKEVIDLSSGYVRSKKTKPLSNHVPEIGKNYRVFFQIGVLF